MSIDPIHPEGEITTTSLGKISMRTIGVAERGSLAKAHQRPCAAARISGTVTGVRGRANDSGEVLMGLHGTFAARPLTDGDAKTAEPVRFTDTVFTSGRCYLPGGLQDEIEALFAGDDAPGSVDFTLDIYAVPAGNKAGFSYEGRYVERPAAKAALEKFARYLLPSPAAALETPAETKHKAKV